MAQARRFPYVEIDPSVGSASALPYVPIQLALGQTAVTVSALIDSGSTLNVLPYSVGLQLGAIWEHQSIRVALTGNLAKSEARAILVSATVDPFSPVRLAFAWTRNDNVPIILGQTNFFAEFDVCFFRSQSAFEIKPRPASRA